MLHAYITYTCDVGLARRADCSRLQCALLLRRSVDLPLAIVGHAYTLWQERDGVVE